MIDILEFIPKGEKNAISASTLAKIAGTDKRGVRHIIHTARTQGALIASGNEGYFQPETLPELKKFYRRMHAQGIATLAAAKYARLKIVEIESELRQELENEPPQ